MEYKIYTKNTIEEIPQWKFLPESLKTELKITTSFFHFKVNNYIIDELINWSSVPEGRLFKLTFPYKEMFDKDDYNYLYEIYKRDSIGSEFNSAKDAIRAKMLHTPSYKINSFIPHNMHGQMGGVYHQFPHTLMLVPRKAHDCFGYCTYCYRWSVIGEKSSVGYDDPSVPVEYLKKNPHITDVLFTGGDPFTMHINDIKSFVSPILSISSVKHIRFATKMLTWWPYRFWDDQDSVSVIDFLSSVVAQGKHVSIMAHFSYPNELTTNSVENAIGALRSTGAVIRCQNPVIKGINDNPICIAKLWQKLTSLGMIPYYLFIDGNPESRSCFKVSLSEAFAIYTKAYQSVSGICATARGPVIINPGVKTELIGIEELYGKKMFVFKHLRHWNVNKVGEVFFRDYDESVCTINDIS
jgi:L-lysine 2,3-aminomutase